MHINGDLIAKWGRGKNRQWREGIFERHSADERMKWECDLISFLVSIQSRPLEKRQIQSSKFWLLCRLSSKAKAAVKARKGDFHLSLSGSCGSFCSPRLLFLSLSGFAPFVSARVSGENMNKVLISNKHHNDDNYMSMYWMCCALLSCTW